ncbi:hypothetical protein [Streptomyces sp. NPDC046862]|uniref:hypothetical protein n=1 Tax=Streptomyces sp. NPDC046862 TaxID=3154603 RepID=UPI003455DFAD
MAAQLNSTVYVQDPDTRQTIELAEGTSPEPRLAALVTNPAAWVDGKLPRLPKAKTEQTGQEGEGPTGDGQDDASGANSEASDADNETATAAKKTAARKSAATTRSRGRNAADLGDSGE